VVTGSSRSTVAAIIEKHFPESFDVIITGDDVVHGKPHPEPYLLATSLAGPFKASQCIAIENAPLGVRSASTAGNTVFGMTQCSPVPTGSLLAMGAARVFKDFHDLQKCLEQYVSHSP
jgi:beta-phosphoglucomutase-like phosphatase (HAD superfamily)